MKTGRKGFRKGAALPFVIIVFFITTTVAGALFTLVNINLKEAVHQKNSIQAYYSVLTGIEIATGALLTDNPDALNDPSVPKNLLASFKKDSSKVLKDTIELDGGRVSVDITISSPEKPGDTGNQWVRIYAEGRYKGAGGKTYTNTGSVWYRVDNPAIYEQHLNS